MEEAECCCVRGPSASPLHRLPGNPSTGPGPPDLLRDPVPGGAGVGPREQRRDNSTYRQENTVEDQEGGLPLYCKRTE